MLTLTEAAGTHLARVLDKRDCADDMAVRIVCRDSRLALSFSGRKSGDAAFEHHGRMVLLVAADAMERLNGSTVDFRQTKAGKKLCHGGKGRRA